MDQEVMTQLSEEVLRLDTRIDNVSDDLDKLDKKVDGINNDAINQRVNDIATVVDNNTSIVNSMDSRIKRSENDIYDIQDVINDHDIRIKDLENKTKQTAQEVAVRAAKSVTRSIENSETQEIHEEIHEVAMAVDNLDASVSPKVRTLENQAYEFSSNISNLHKEDSSIWNAMNDMDVEHHEELHKLALAIDNHESRIKYIETHWFDYEDEIDRIDNKIDASIAEMKGYIDNKIDASISGLQDDIDDVSTGLANVTTIVNNLPPHIVLTKEEYDNLENPDYNSFYFTYEDEE
jgi:chromosome segregation ATPase